ncbi:MULTISPECIES: hypothetical protein [unclassified Bradyrhizobium]|uniref:hypothetical protein n=1 Tax=unclassified Bradyrhizobium TaxID=2631580 RepID=UPI001FF7CACB|nr:MULTISPECIES: hypothetical protein [unclassified Bradyrhizobium]MCK1312567.1 hypothetical protein [Bradyrhizobium sp. 23]MCK1401309.1 hypothetical protein [Bradyrhizobium sp. 39]MCK1752287.1 hypothetical protein [Bradyrhizobium sp. 135]UPJ39146.1 hypothetical protein IVB45_37135 [Bradyrhizobium sp. 4]
MTKHLVDWGALLRDFTADARTGMNINVSRHSCKIDDGYAPFLSWVIRDFVEPVASPAMSAMPPKAKVTSEH